MNVKTFCNIGDIIYIYDPQDDSERERVIDNIVITRNGDNYVRDRDILLRANMYDNICNYEQLVNSIPDNTGLYYFRCKKSRQIFKESIKGDNVHG